MKRITNLFVSSPAGSAQFFVQVFSASNLESATRLNAIAQERAEIIATKIQKRVLHDGIPFAATSALRIANGKAKTECSILIMRKTIRSFFSILGFPPALPYFMRQPELIQYPGNDENDAAGTRNT
jgi:hypothetical protein